MKRNHWIPIAIAAGALLLLLWMLASSGENPRSGRADLPATGQDAEVWTCSMHPQVRQSQPGDCPICGMDLIPLRGDSSGSAGPRTLVMSDAARALARVETSEVRRGIPEMELRMVGKLEPDATRVRSLAARFPGRIEQLFVNFAGTRVGDGEHLATIYSPELLTAQAELLQAVQFDPGGRAAQSAREKLRLWGLPQAEVDAIVERGQPSDTLTIYAPVGGIVTEKSVSEGDYVQTGQMLFEIADLSQLWLDLDAYESDIGWIRLGQDVRFDVESYPGRSFEGTVAFIEPFLDESTRTVNVRVNVDNSEGLLKPGMLARGTVHPRIGPGGQVYAEDLAGKFISPMHPWIVKDAPGNCDICGMALVPAEELGYATSPQAGEPPMLVPAGAVLRTGKRAVVYVEKENAGQAAYEGREITLGPRTNDGFIVFDGLREGERVVSNGAFKIDSALQIEAKPSMMNPAPVLVGADDEAAGHAHGGHGQSTPQTPPADDAGMVPVEQAVAALGPYLALQEALAADNLEGAQEALRDMMAATGHSGPLPGIIHAMLAAEDIDALRKPLFDKLSASMIEVVKAHPDRFPTLLQMHCPMVYRDRGADWLQRERPLRNPYFGAMMLSCGEVTATLGQQSQPD